jgi:hypothetical protein
MAVRGDAWERLRARSNGNQPPAQHLLLAILRDNYYLTADESGDPFAVALDTPSVVVPIKGLRGSLRQRLSADMWDLTDGRATASSEALSTVMGVVEGLASGQPRANPALRVALTGRGQIALDLGRPDGAMVLLSPTGWQLANRGALFRRGAAISPLPDPVRGGRPPSLVNIRGRNELALYTACRVASIFPWGTKAVEMMTGQPGSAKTATARITVRWLGGYMTPMSRDPRDWMATAKGAHCLGHDNVSGMSAARQDLLNVAASGGEYLARALYSDADLYAMRFTPMSIVITGVELGMLRTDFIRRSVVHELVKPDAYLTDSEVTSRWEREHPSALGWLLDVTCNVMDMMTRVERPRGDSLADFSWVLAAIDAMWGTDALGLWRFDQEAMYAELAQGDPVALSVTKVITGPFEGTAGELLDKLKDANSLPSGGNGPWTPRKLSGALVRAQSAFEAGGWKVIRMRDPHTKNYRYTILPPGF